VPLGILIAAISEAFWARDFLNFLLPSVSKVPVMVIRGISPPSLTISIDLEIK
jgi:hypothetical protein